MYSEADQTYELADSERAIRCKLCGKTSWNLNDVRHRYCGRCHIFHDDRRASSLTHAERHPAERGSI